MDERLERAPEDGHADRLEDLFPKGKPEIIDGSELDIGAETKDTAEEDAAICEVLKQKGAWCPGETVEQFVARLRSVRFDDGEDGIAFLKESLGTSDSD